MFDLAELYFHITSPKGWIYTNMLQTVFEDYKIICDCSDFFKLAILLLQCLTMSLNCDLRRACVPIISKATSLSLII